MFEKVGRSRRGRPRESVRDVVVSTGLHAVLIGMLLWIGDGGAIFLPGSGERSDGWGTGPTDGPAGGGGGGQEMVTYIDIAPPMPTPPQPEPVPEPIPEEEIVAPLPTPVEIDVPEIAVPRVLGTVVAGGIGGSPGSGPGMGPGSGGGSGGGTGEGIGSGVGPGTGGGRGEGGIRPPVPTAVFLPPPAPRSLRGKTVTLRLSVDPEGRVSEVDLETPTGDRSFESRLRRTAMDWRFEPARDASNRAVAAQTEVSFSF